MHNIERLEKQRNDLVHTTWYIDKSTSEIKSFKPVTNFAKGFTFKPVDGSIPVLKEMSQELELSIYALADIMWNWLKEYPSSNFNKFLDTLSNRPNENISNDNYEKET